MDLERSLGNIKIDENPWRSHEQTPQPWGAPMPAGPNAGANPGGWGHMSPQQIRNPWPDPSNLAQNVNEALGLAGAPSAQGGWGAPMGGPPGDFGDAAKIWSEPHADQQHFQPMHNHHRGMNGMMGDPAGGDWMGGPGQSQQQPPMWSDPIKQEQEGYWKQQQQQGGWSMPNGPNPMGFPRGGPPNRGVPRGHGGPQMGMPMAPMRVAPPGGWNPQANVYAPMGRQQGGVSSERGMWSRGGPPQMGGAGGGRGGYPGGVDMSVPPPIDMPPGGMGQMNGMRVPMPPGGMWKQQDQMSSRGSVNGMQGGNPYGQMGAPAPFGMPPKQHAAPGQFPIAGADDLMWHDPNGDLKKWQRDTGVSLWGDPEKCNERPVRLWMVDEGQEEELEVALMKCPVPPKRNEDGTARLPFNLPSKRPIVVTGWGELPENDPNNPVKPEDMPSGSKWGDMTPVPPVNDSSPWYLPGQQSASAYAPESPAWGQPQPPTSASASSMVSMPHMIPDGSAPGPPQAPSSSNPNTQQIADQLRYAVDKGYLDMSILTHVTLPPPVLQNMTAMLSKIPQLESVEGELKQLVDSVRPEGEQEGSSPQRWMNEVQKIEYNRLIIEVTTSKIEVTDLSKKINAGLLEAGMGPVAQPEGNGARSEAYHYSFLE